MSADQPDYDFIEAQERGYDEAERMREEIDRLRSRIMEMEKGVATTCATPAVASTCRRTTSSC